jgi:RNA polymerase sigma-70 factor (ECF subfamily)
LSEIGLDAENLLERARRLDRNALGQVYDRYYPEVYRYVAYRLSDEQGSEEIASRVFLSFLEAIEKRSGPTRNLPGWLLETAGKITSEQLGRISPTPLLTQGVKRKEGTRGKVEALLPAEQQHLLALRFAQDRSLDETAELAGKTPQQVNYLQYRSLIALSGRSASKSKADPQIRILEICIQRLQAGDSPEEILSVYPKWINELQPIVLAAQSAYHQGQVIIVPEEARARSRAGFLGTAQERIPPSPRPRSAWLGRFLLAVIVTLLVAGLGVALAVKVSAQALPGDFLYPVKTANQQARLIFTRRPVQRLQLERAIDQERLGEVKALLQHPRQVEVNFTGGLSEIKIGEWQVEGIRVLVPSDAQMVGKIQPGFYADIQGVVQPDGSLLARRLQVREYEIQGTVQSKSPDQMVISGMSVMLMPETIFQGSLATGEQARAVVWLSIDQVWQARLVESQK